MQREDSFADTKKEIKKKTELGETGGRKLSEKLCLVYCETVKKENEKKKIYISRESKECKKIM